MGEEKDRVLASAAEGDDLRLAIPAWHPLFGRYPSIAHWLADAHGPAVEPANKNIPLFTAFGVPVSAKRSFLPAFALVAYQFGMYFFAAHRGLGLPVGMAEGVAAAALLYATVLAHEYGHLLAARAFGIRTLHIVLNFMGGGAAVVRGFRQALPEFVIALAGPVVSALAGVAFFAAALAFPGTLAAGIFSLIGGLNFLLAGFNLLPMFPMDGGRVLRAALTRFFGSYRATRIAAVVSVFASGLLLYSGLHIALTASLWPGLMRAAAGLFFAFVAVLMSVHPGTVTIDERPSAKS